MLSKKYIFIIYLLLFVLHCANIHSKPSSLQGRHFLIGFMQNEIPRPELQTTFYASIFVSTTQSDTITIEVPGEAPLIVEVPANQIYEVKLRHEFEITNVGINANKLVDIRSKHPIVCWAYSSKNQSSDSYVSIPVSVWSNEYRVVSMPNDMYNGKERLIADKIIDEITGDIIDMAKYVEHVTPRSGELLIMASLDNTIVEYYPTCDTRNDVYAGQKGTISLNAGECALIQALDGQLGTQDLTGTYIKSNNPVGVISGHVRTAVEQGLDNPYDTKDHLLEMLPPTLAWGKKFISVPFIDGQNVNTDNYHALCGSGDLLRVIARETNTKITYSIHNDDNTFTVKTYTIPKAGGVFNFETNKPVIWEADKPVMISQFMMHKGNLGESLDYDPSYVILTPTEQYMEEVYFSTPSNNKVFEQYKAHAFIAITDTAGLYSLFFDGQNLSTASTIWAQQIGNSEYYWVMKVISAGTHKLVANKGKFSGIIYGHGFRDSYSMTLGARLNDPTKEDTIAPVIEETTNSCGSFRIKLSDVLSNDPNATGIDWGYIKNVVNYDVSDLNITDTSTIVEIFASPTDTTKDASFDLEFYDKSYNILRRSFKYSGFNFAYQPAYNLGMLNWELPTYIKITIKNNGTSDKQLKSIAIPSDNRASITLDKPLPYNIAPNESVIVDFSFTPDGSITALNTLVSLIFECDTINIPVTGKISAPGLIAESLDFYKVRLHDSKTLTGKIYNAGNIPLVINSINSDILESVFAWNYSDNLPLNLAIGDSLSYDVTFTPTEKAEYIVNLTVSNNNNTPCEFYVKGIGVAPNIENIVLDWGKRRIGTKSDTIINIVNSGDFVDTIDFKSNYSITHSTDLSVDTIEQVNNLVIEEYASTQQALSFIPSDTLPMENIFELSSSWTQHGTIFATVKAQGTIPVIESYDYDFGNVSIFSTTQIFHNAIYSNGNEALTIDSITPIGGDINSFVIDYSRLYNITIEPQYYFALQVDFVPKFSGNHKIYLEITHDANPNYARTKDTIVIYGNCITDNADLIANLQVPTVLSCQTNTISLNLENTSNAKIDIDSIIFATNPNNIEMSVPNINFPLELAAYKTLEFPVNIFAEKDDSTEINANIFYNASSKIQLIEKIEPKAAIITSLFVQPQKLMYPGDTLILWCKSNLNHKAERPSSLIINLHFDRNLFYCLSEKCNINLISNSQNQTFEVAITQKEDYIEFDLSSINFEILDDNTSIEFAIPLLALLNETKVSQFVFELSSERCYDSEPFSIELQVEPVCADGLRQLVFDKFSYMFVSQNPALDEIKLVVNLIEDDNVTLVISDILGNVVYEKEHNLSVGKHDLSINLNTIATTELFITAKSSQFNTTQKVILMRY